MKAADQIIREEDEMADPTGSVTPEGAALQLLRMIAHAEGKSLTEGVPAG